jgi:hypothetical protein
VTVVHKANVLKVLSGLFLEVGREVAKEYPGRVEMNDRIVDACAMQLVLDPWQFDVLVATNLFGDILSDLMAGLIGGLGLAPGRQYRRERGYFRGGARLGARHRRQGDRQPAGIAARGRADARPCRAVRPGAASARRGQRGQYPHPRPRRRRLDTRFRRSGRQAPIAAGTIGLLCAQSSLCCGPSQFACWAWML